jgi:hypothetical protein
MKPWMHQLEIEKIRSYLQDDHKMFEWGCGGSTLYFSKYVDLYRSVEHDVNWYKKILPYVQSNTELHYIDNHNEYNDYINFIEKFSDSYDTILIDGRERVRCSIKAKQYLNTNGILIVHDFFKRPKYNPILEFYNIIDEIKNTEQTLAIFKLK